MALSARSVSSTMHDRVVAKVPASAPVSGNVSASSATTRQSRTHHQHHRHSNPSRPSSSTATNAKETFLGYFFGQPENGSATPPATATPVASVGLSAAMASGGAPSGRDTSQSPAPTGLLAGKVGQDGSNTAFDMKSLGKHIEAVSILHPVKF